jgi:hypothetical protein
MGEGSEAREAENSAGLAQSRRGQKRSRNRLRFNLETALLQLKKVVMLLVIKA